LGYWAYPWEKKPRKNSEHAETVFGFDKSQVDAVRQWVGEKAGANLISWQGVFMEKQIAAEYRSKFFSNIQNALLLAIYFSEDEKRDVLGEFKPESEKFGEIGIYQMLMKQSLESNADEESLIGYDLIGIEYGGDFHSFHCHDLADELTEKFGLVLNDVGLFNEFSNWKPIIEYMNDEENGFEPVPWFVVKVKLVHV